MDSWSGFRVHTVIFHHVSAPPKLTASVRIQKLCGLSVCLHLPDSSRGRRTGEPSKTKVDSNDTTRKTKRRERRSEEKAYYQQTDGPPIHSGPAGTWRDTSLHLRVTSAAARGGALKHGSACVHFGLLTCKQKANLRHLWRGATLCSTSKCSQEFLTVSFRRFVTSKDESRTSSDDTSSPLRML